MRRAKAEALGTRIACDACYRATGASRQPPPGMIQVSGWRGASLGVPVTVHDLNGQPLFYDFPVVGPDGGPLGAIRASAATPLGAAVASVSLGPARWEMGAACLRHVRRGMGTASA